ncbi:helix-turn-helix domain-containing protein [Acetobacter okinawensis]|uniref:helix-turn-helix transcriptional regulator n=1 Tax=Acetobacter okinawensis TaxID=1076594 RepID=UPI001BACF9DB|nr:helix-turn-helix domain-containing protein [Acetobacter okinawensis]MBS0966156.1 helix-turn-helix domain-containing protein [Acetobacter okinawensis]
MGDITPRLLSVEEAARYVGLSRPVFQATIGKQIPPIKTGVRRLIWDRIALDRWIDAQSGVASPEKKEINPLDALM